jgi:branched-chain amino acid transport system ATP-binding protein/urea transport system ATP-binding protein
MSLIVVEQNLDFITQLSDRVLNIQKGRITGELDRDSLMAREAAMIPT